MNKIIFLLILPYFVLVNNGFSQDDKKDLELKIFNLNNEFKYTESQNILLSVINGNSPKSKKLEACILLSNTYKRVFDYTTAKKYLTQAHIYAISLNQTNRILALEAMILFDTHKYKAAKKSMVNLEKSYFKGLTDEEIAIILMQIGYTYYLENNYQIAKSYYHKSITIMNQDSKSCNQPIVYGKLFALFKAMHQSDSIESLYNKGIISAKRCNILKYQLYLMEEYLKVIDSTNYKRKITLVKSIDSIKSLYEPSKKISELLNSKADKIEKTLKKEQKTNYYHSVIMGVLILTIGIGGYILYSKITDKKKLLGKENTRIKEKMVSFSNTSNDKDKLNQLANEKELTERQKEILDLVNEGNTNKEISEELHISENTVKYHVKNINRILKQKGIKIERRK